MMATIEPNINVSLLQELKKKYPEIPEYVVTSKMKQHKNDRAKCIEVLDGETPNFLFEQSPQQNQTSYQELQMTSAIEGRQRSDSGSSGVSSTSTCSISSSSSVPYTNPNHGAVNYHHESRPQQISTGTLDQFATQQRNPANIPNIQCDVFGSSNRPSGYNYQGVQNTPPTPPRQIHVHHNLPVVNQSQGHPPAIISRQTPQCIEIQITPRVPQDQFRQNVQPSRPQNSYSTWGKSHTGNGVSYNHSNSGYNSLDRYKLSRRPAPPVPTSQNHGQTNDGHSQVPTSLQISSPSKSYIHSPSTPQPENFSSQKTIYLQHSKSAGQFSTITGERTSFQSSGDFVSNNMHTSHSESNLQQPPYIPNVSPGECPQGMNNHHLRSPLHVRLEDTEPNSVHSSYYNPHLPVDTPVNVNNRYHNINYGDPFVGGAVNPPSYPVFPVTSGASPNDSEQMFGHYPVIIPNRCPIQGHPPVYARTPSSDSDRRSIPTPPVEDSRHTVHAHVAFPPVSIGGATEISGVQRPLSSGSGSEEADYTNALLQFQREKMEKLKQDLESELRKLIKTRSEVQQMEKNMLERKRTKNFYNYQPLEDVSRLREINRRLKADIQVMAREVDMYNNGQTPLGVLDPLEQQNFFKNMNTGPQGSIYSRPPPQTPSRETPPPIPPRTPITAPTAIVPPAPPPQPLQDSDGDGEHWNCSACTFLNHPALNKCECCEMPRMNTSPPETGRVRHVCTSNLCYCHDK